MRALAIGAALAAFAFALSPAQASAQSLDLLPNPVDDDGQVTLGEVFDGAGAAAGMVVARRSGPTVVIESATLQAAARQAGLNWANPMGLRRVVVRGAAVAAAPASVAGQTPAQQTARPSTAVASAPAGRTVEVLTYARSLAAGDIIQPEDVIWSTVQAHQAAGGAPSDAEQVIGMTARRALRAGSAVAVRDLTSPQVIARNDAVEVAFVAGGVRLTVTGRATRAAAVGEPLQIINSQSGRAIDAVATGPGRAVAGPAAHTVRTQQFASR